jgi:pimeloyl-ACP methyl ester carboxylesterase
VRVDVTFPSGDGGCAGWLYRPDGAARDVPCVVMGHGFSLTRHDALAAYASVFADAGCAVLVFDYRGFGDSPGEPRQRFRIGMQREDWRSAIAFARTLDGVDAQRIALWGYSMACSSVVPAAAKAPNGIAAVLTLCPFVDGLPRVLRTPPGLIAWITPRAIADLAGRHITIPVTAAPGDHGAMTFEGERQGFAMTVAPDSPWRNEISPGIFLTVAMLRPVTLASRLRMPVWVGLGTRDITVSAKAAERLAYDAPQGELHRYPFDHFGAFTRAGIDEIAADQVAFLRRAL